MNRLPLLPADEMEKGKGDLWEIPMTHFIPPTVKNCALPTDILRIRIITTDTIVANDGWNIDSIVVYGRMDNDCDVLLSLDVDVFQWVEDPTEPLFGLHVVAGQLIEEDSKSSCNCCMCTSFCILSAVCLQAIYVMGFTDHLDSCSVPNPNLEIVVQGDVYSAPLPDIPRDMMSYKGDLWKMPLDLFGIPSSRCISPEYIEKMTILPNSPR